MQNRNFNFWKSGLVNDLQNLEIGLEKRHSQPWCHPCRGPASCCCLTYFLCCYFFKSFINSLKARTLNDVLPVCAPVSRVLERNPKYTFAAGKENETWPPEIFICCLVQELSNYFYPVHRCSPQKMLDCKDMDPRKHPLKGLSSRMLFVGDLNHTVLSTTL